MPSRDIRKCLCFSVWCFFPEASYRECTNWCTLVSWNWSVRQKRPFKLLRYTAAWRDSYRPCLGNTGVRHAAATGAVSASKSGKYRVHAPLRPSPDRVWCLKDCQPSEHAHWHRQSWPRASPCRTLPRTAFSGAHAVWHCAVSLQIAPGRGHGSEIVRKGTGPIFVSLWFGVVFPRE